MRKLFYKEEGEVIYLTWFTWSLIIIALPVIFIGLIACIGEIVVWLTS